VSPARFLGTQANRRSACDL